MKRICPSKLNHTQRQKIEELMNLCCAHEPIRLSVPIPPAGKELRDERFFLLYDQGILLSLIHLFYPDETVGELIGFTHPDYRGRGYFRLLLDLAADYADEIGLDQVYLISDGNSFDAAGALTSLGLEAEYAEFMLEKSVDNRTVSSFLATDETDSPDDLTVAEITSSSLPANLFSEIFRTDSEQCETYLAEISADERIHTYVLTRNGIPVGQTQITLMDDVAYLSGFGILPNYRRRGYAQFFLRKLEQLLRSYNVTDLTLQVSDKNKPALSLYRKDGFKTLEALHYYPLFAEE